ncbi:MAG: SLC13 family permease [Rhodospirillaceae bacterium]|jgi:anion transporter|nr:SLC13 family permease [Rhodospirillaceae bacterium]MBT3494121.1 SLC13 family permease [Rhodospirillaceae bacterium]MBT3779307.1 SLC13 family permease [Rhodospirillaceae bacterium]MBT3975394.1 SLC13 family permease [Rhodospirillaceae bacterium]MBT4167599.1 SLC13 family permease [Rhodospirillaceae bacterium]
MKISFWIAALGILAALALALVPIDGLAPETARTGALALATVVLFATGALPEFVTAILFFAIATLFALAPANVVFAGFQSAGFWMVFGGLVIGVGVRGTGLAERLAHGVGRRFGHRYAAIISGTVILGLVMAFLMPSTMGRLMILMPIVLAMADGFGYQAGSNGRTGMVLAISFSTMIPGFAIMSATVPAMVVIGASETLYGEVPTYGIWLLLHFPVLGALKAIIIAVLVIWLFPAADAKAPTEPAEAPAAMAGRERLMALMLLLALALWMTDFLHHISPAWVSLGVAGIIVLPFVGIVGARDFDDKIQFSTLLYVAGMLSMGALVAHGGTGDLLAKSVLPLLNLGSGESIWNFAAVVGLSSGLAMFATQPGVPAILVPLVGHLAEAADLPVMAMLMLTVVGYSTVILPYQAPPLVVAMQLGAVPMRQGNKLCLWLLAVTVLVLLPLDYLWWRLLGWLP